MRVARFGDVGQEIPALERDGRIFDLRSVVEDIDAKALSPEGLERIRSATELPELDVQGLRVGVPIARPGSVFCIGMNYAAHAAESGANPPERPVLFMKPANTVVGPNDPVDVPRGSTRADWEVELAIVIGSHAVYLESEQAAARAIAGYTMANDLSEREWQLEISGGQWGKGKAAPGFTPVGPWFVPSSDIDANALRLRSWVNGEPRQDSSTADMIFSPTRIVWELSQHLAFEPGDLILTGTPEGVALSGRFPYLSAGDIVELEIDGLGRQRQEMGQA